MQYSEHGGSPGRYYNNNTVYSFNEFSVLWERKACKKITFHTAMFHDSTMSIMLWKFFFFLHFFGHAFLFPDPTSTPHYS